MAWLYLGLYFVPFHDDVIKWIHFPRYWPFVRGIYRSPVKSPHNGQWRGDLIFSLGCAWINGWIKNREAGDLRRHRAHYDVILMYHAMIMKIRVRCFNQPKNTDHYAIPQIWGWTSRVLCRYNYIKYRKACRVPHWFILKFIYAVSECVCVCVWYMQYITRK